MSIVQRAEAAEHAMAQELDRLVVKSTIYVSGEHDPRQPVPRPPDAGRRYMMMGDDPRLPKMPDRPTLFDFFRLRLGPTQHPLQSARLAQDIPGAKGRFELLPFCGHLVPEERPVELAALVRELVHDDDGGGTV